MCTRRINSTLAKDFAITTPPFVWGMYDASTHVTAKIVEPNKRIVIEWDGYSGRTTVEWKFASQTNNAPFVSITESGWTGTGDELVEYATTATRGIHLDACWPQSTPGAQR
jgi:uncharacterized protein YndB with AHSA1/START domain